LNPAPINNAAELATYLWHYDEYTDVAMLGGAWQFGFTPMRGGYLMDYTEDNWFIAHALWDEVLRRGYMTRV
jgi:hypothetical protein